MAKFRAIEKGYYNDVIHDPETDHHVIFEAPDDFKASWAVLADSDAVVEPIVEASKDTAAAEEILETEAKVAASSVEGQESVASDDVVDVNEETGVTVL